MTEHGGAAALKQNNLAALRSALYHTDFATKKELAEQCRLSLAACTALLGEMIDDGQVLEARLCRIERRPSRAPLFHQPKLRAHSVPVYR